MRIPGCQVQAPERLVRAATFLLLSALFVFLLTSNRINLLIIHGHSWTIAVAAMFLAILGLNELWGFVHDATACFHPQCACSGNHITQNKLKWLFVNAFIFMAPVLLSFSTTPAVFDANAAMHRGLKMNILSADYQIGSIVELTGFVVRWEDLPRDEIVVTRFIVSCCVADAIPVGVTVRWPGAASYAINSWVHVKGIVQQENRPPRGGSHSNSASKSDSNSGTKLRLFVQAYLITPVGKPEQPYLYHDH